MSSRETIDDQALREIRAAIPQLVEQLRLPTDVDLKAWKQVLDQKMLPRLAPDFPLIAAICGGGSSGKSSLFNALLEDHLSPTGGTAGINKRILIAGSLRGSRSEAQFPALFEPYGYRPRKLKHKNQLLEPGEPVFTLSRQIDEALVVLDTPDFDTGFNGRYTNREVARQALEAADILIYIFTNANYNNRGNTDFIARMLTGIGSRKCFLVYRAHQSYADHEILAHAATVGEHLYGPGARDQVLGVYRADEDNRVAAGQAFMALRAVGNQKKHLREALQQLDVQQIRSQLLLSVYRDVLKQAEVVVQQAVSSRNWLSLYVDALRTLESHAAQEALRHFPVDRLLRRFTELWYATDPAHIRWMRKTGAVIDYPLKAMLRTAKWFGGGRKPSPEKEAFSEQIEGDLLKALDELRQNSLRQKLKVTLLKNDPVSRHMQACMTPTAEAIEGSMQAREQRDRVTFTVAAHPVVKPAQKRLQSKNWQQTSADVLAGKSTLIGVSARIDRQLHVLVEGFRRRMTLMARFRQTFSAFLNVLPATAAITYILSTGDPVGATGIKIKLAGLFGLKDLYALVAIPATTGLKKADRAQLAQLIGPIAKVWLDEQLQSVRLLLHTAVSGALLENAAGVIDQSGNLIERTQRTIDAIRKPSIL